jgi:hypothetical protein
MMYDNRHITGHSFTGADVIMDCCLTECVTNGAVVINSTLKNCDWQTSYIQNCVVTAHLELDEVDDE